MIILLRSAMPGSAMGRVDRCRTFRMRLSKPHSRFLPLKRSRRLEFRVVRNSRVFHRNSSKRHRVAAASIGAHGEGSRVPVIPAKAGIQHSEALSYWIPAFAGMTRIEAPMWRTPRDEAIQKLWGAGPGLLRFARNDVEIGTDGKVRQHAAKRCIGASRATCALPAPRPLNPSSAPSAA
jgi:hypothetical protein